MEQQVVRLLKQVDELWWYWVLKPPPPTKSTIRIRVNGLMVNFLKTF